MNCTICGKQMDYTGFGNYRCQECDHVMNDLVHRPSNCDMPMPQGFGEERGWICPVCGRGVAPWMNWCPCQKDAYANTINSNVGPISLDEYASVLNQGVIYEDAKLESDLNGKKSNCPY